METEQWRPVVGFEGWYEVSSFGRVRRVAPQPAYWQGRIVKAHPNKNGRLTVGLSRHSACHTMLLSRVVAAAFHGPPQPGQEANHIDGHPWNNRADNLEWVSRSGNMLHAYRLGLIERPQLEPGKAWRSAKLTIEQAKEIYDLAGKVTHREICERYGISMSMVSRIQNGHSWGNIGLEKPPARRPRCYPDIKGEKHPQWKGGTINRHGIRVVVRGNQRRPEHLFVWEDAHGPVPPGFKIAWKNGDRLDNRLENLELVSKTAGPCTIEGCGKKAKGHGLCPTHHSRLRRNGDPSVAYLPYGRIKATR